MQKANLSFLFLLLALPAYAHHVPGPSSASVTVSIPGCTDPSCSVTLTTANGLNCRDSSVPFPGDGKRNVTCNLPQPLRIPAVALPGQPQFELTRTTAATDPVTLVPLGAEFVALCNAVGGGACDNTIQYKFQNSTIRKIAGLGTTTQQVRIDMGFTMGLLPDQSLNSSIVDATVGRAHGFSSKGTFVPAGALTAFGNTHSAAASFTYVLSNAQCGTTDAALPDPFSISGCTATMAIPCSSPATDTNKGVTCSSTAGSYEVKSSTLTSWNAISVAGGLNLIDGVQRLCTNLFGQNKECRAIERGTATLTYGLRRINDRVNITASGEGHSGVFSDVLTVAAAEGTKCLLHNSTGGTVVSPNSSGQFQVYVFGSAELDTNTLDVTKTFLSLPGGTLIPALGINYNFNFADPETGVADEYFDARVSYDSSLLDPAGITCAAYNDQSITLVQEAGGDVTVSGTTVVAGSGKGKSGKGGTKNFGDFTETNSAQLFCEIPALVKCP